MWIDDHDGEGIAAIHLKLQFNAGSMLEPATSQKYYRAVWETGIMSVMMSGASTVLIV